MPQTSQIMNLGEVPYEQCVESMRKFTLARDESSPDFFWLVQHTPVFTLGQAANIENVLKPGVIPVIKTDRGGDVTYHGPGQVVLYTLVDLRRARVFVRDWVSTLETTTITFLRRYGIQSQRRAGAPGIYVTPNAVQASYQGGAKIASLGLRVKNGRAYHGIALNVAMDLTPFLAINPCGMVNLPVTDMREVSPIPFDFPIELIAHEFSTQIKYAWDTLAKVEI